MKASVKKLRCGSQPRSSALTTCSVAWPNHSARPLAFIGDGARTEQAPATPSAVHNANHRRRLRQKLEISWRCHTVAGISRPLRSAQARLGRPLAETLVQCAKSGPN